MVKCDPNVDYGGKVVGQPFEGEVHKNITFFTAIDESTNLYSAMKNVLCFRDTAGNQRRIDEPSMPAWSTSLPYFAHG